jgi:ribosomal protein S18 acetylase RimI-like enzyme
MSGSSDPELLRRLVEFELVLERDSSETVEKFDWGRLIFNPKTKALWSGNYLEVHTTDRDADALAELADEVLSPRGIRHRFVRPVDLADADRLVAGFQALEGWEVRRSVYMVLAREPDREAGPAREVPRAAVEAVRRAVAEDNPNFGKEGVEQRFIRDARMDSIGNGRWFAAPPEGPPGASCVLYERDGIGQVETVGTAPEARGQGLASAVVMAAAAASRDRGDELTFIVADADDWPWQLYEHLGFDRLGEVCDFLKKPLSYLLKSPCRSRP